jgi:hypothetical protein
MTNSVSWRVKDSEKMLRRNTLLEKIGHDLSTKMELEKEQAHLTGLLVLYNNMLQSLFECPTHFKTESGIQRKTGFLRVCPDS